MRFQPALSATLLLALTLICAPHARAAFAEMTVSDGYRVSVRHDEKIMRVSWRPLGNGSAPTPNTAMLDTAFSAFDGRTELTPIAGSQAALLEQKVAIAVAIDMRSQSVFFDQLAALRMMLATADFSRQRWLLFNAASPQAPFAEIISDADMAKAWQRLKETLLQTSDEPGAAITTLAPIIAQIAVVPGDRKALVVPQGLVKTLTPGLTAQGIAGLQAFGISLYPLTRSLSSSAEQPYKVLASASGGNVLAWLDVPPAADVAAATFAPLLQGGTSTYVLPPPPWQPWKQPAPLTLSLTQDGAQILLLNVPRLPSKWSTLPWGVIAGLATLFILAAGTAIMWLRKQTRTPLRVTLTDLSAKTRHEITQWPATLGRSEEADITIANAHLRPLHLRLSDNGTGLDLNLLEEGTVMTLNGKQARTHSLYQTADLTLESLQLRIEFTA